MSGAEIRLTIVDALEEAIAAAKVESTLVAAFEEGERDIPLVELSLDSFSRVELLAALEMEFETVILPDVFAQFKSLCDIVAHVESSQGEHGTAGATDEPFADDSTVVDDPCEPSSEAATASDGPAPRIAQLFKRLFHHCRTVAEMNLLLDRLSDRMVPLEATSLRTWQQQGRLIPAEAPPKFGAALSEWLDAFERAMRASGKIEPEPFTCRRIAPAAMHYTGPGEPADKTLLVCFSIIGYRTMSIPQAVFLQHIDARKYDLLFLSDPWHTAFRTGVPMMGGDVLAVVRWVADLALLRQYARLRAIGSSAGAYPATLTGRRIGAELTVGLNGRFPSERHLATLIKMYFHSLVASVRNRKARVLLTHGVTKSRDTAFARRLGWLTGASRLAVKMPDRNLGHALLPPLLEHGELKDFLDRTLFAPLESEWFAEQRAVVTVRYPLDAAPTH